MYSGVSQGGVVNTPNGDSIPFTDVGVYNLITTPQTKTQGKYSTCDGAGDCHNLTAITVQTGGSTITINDGKITVTTGSTTKTYTYPVQPDALPGGASVKYTSPDTVVVVDSEGTNITAKTVSGQIVLSTQTPANYTSPVTGLLVNTDLNCGIEQPNGDYKPAASDAVTYTDEYKAKCLQHKYKVTDPNQVVMGVNVQDVMSATPGAGTMLGPDSKVEFKDINTVTTPLKNFTLTGYIQPTTATGTQTNILDLKTSDKTSDKDVKVVLENDRVKIVVTDPSTGNTVASTPVIVVPTNQFVTTSVVRKTNDTLTLIVQDKDGNVIGQQSIPDPLGDKAVDVKALTVGDDKSGGVNTNIDNVELLAEAKTPEEIKTSVKDPSTEDKTVFQVDVNEADPNKITLKTGPASNNDGSKITGTASPGTNVSPSTIPTTPNVTPTGKQTITQSQSDTCYTVINALTAATAECEAKKKLARDACLLLIASGVYFCVIYLLMSLFTDLYVKNFFFF